MIQWMYMLEGWAIRFGRTHGPSKVKASDKATMPLARFEAELCERIVNHLQCMICWMCMLQGRDVLAWRWAVLGPGDVSTCLAMGGRAWQWVGVQPVTVKSDHVSTRWRWAASETQ